MTVVVAVLSGGGRCLATTLVFAEQVADDTVDEEEEDAEAVAELLPLPPLRPMPPLALPEAADADGAAAAPDKLGASLPLALLVLRVVVVCLRSDCSII